MLYEARQDAYASMADCASAEKDARPRFDPPPRVKGPPKYSTSYTRETLEAAVQDVLRGEALREEEDEGLLTSNE